MIMGILKSKDAEDFVGWITCALLETFVWLLFLLPILLALGVIEV